MENEILPGLVVDRNEKHAYVRPGISSVIVIPNTGNRLEEIRTLDLPETVLSFSGLEQFPNLRRIRYDGASDVFSLEEPVSWMGKDSDKLDVFATKLATNLLAFRPIPTSLCAIIAPHMLPVQAGHGWKKLIGALEDRLYSAETAGGIRQDASREHVIICRSYTIFKHLQYAFSLGRAISTVPYAAEAEAAYAREEILKPKEQVDMLLAMGQNHGYEELSGVNGDRRVEVMKELPIYADYLGNEISWQDNERFQRMLLELLDDGLITGNNYPAVLDQLAAHRMTASTALLIRCCAKHPELRLHIEEDDFFA